MGTTTGLKPDSMIYDPDNDSFYRAGDSFGSAIDYLRAVTGIDYPDYAAEAISDAQKQDYINSLLETDPSLASPTEYLALNQYQSQAPLNEMVASMRSVGADDNTVGNLVLAKDNEFQDKVAALGGVNKETLGAVIDAAQQTYGEGDSRAVATVVSEAFKAGLQMKDLAEAAGIEEADVVNAARTAAQDPNKALSLPEMGREAVNTVFEVGNKVADLVETGLEKTGIEKVIDTVGNTVAKIIGLDPNSTKKVVVFNPTTGQVTVQASNIPGGGILGNLPQSPYVPVGATSGGTIYGVDMENAVLNTVLGKVLNNEGLEEGDIAAVVAASVEESTGIPMEVAGNVIDVAGAVVDQTGKIIKDSGILNVSDDNTGTTLTIDGAGNTGGGDTSFENIMGPIDTRTEAEKAADAEEAANRTYTSVGSSTQDLLDLIANSGTGEEDDDSTLTITGGTVTLNDDKEVVCGKNQYKDFVTGQCVDIPCPAGQERNKNGDCYTPGVGGRTTVDEDLTVADITANTPCDNADEVRDPVTLVCGKPTGGGGTDKIVCPDTYNNAGAKVDSLDECGGLKSTGGQTKVCPKGTRLADQTVDINTDCGIITGGQTKVCPKGTRLADQTVDINTDCGTLGGQTKVCPKGTRLADQTVDINTDCGTLGGQTKVCPKGTRLADQTVDINTDCGTLGGQTKVCETGTRLAGQTVDINADCGTITGGGSQTKICPDGTRLAGQTVDIKTDCGTLGGQTKVCPEGTRLAGQTVDINTDCGIITGGDDDKVCPAGQTLNAVTGECEYTKFVCGPGFTLNILTGQCEKDTDVEDEEEDVFTFTPPSLGLANRGDFVDRGDVLVENTGEMGGIYSILPAPIREPFLAGNRQQDIRNVADVVGIRQGEDFNQDPEAVQRFARYANAFDIGVPELLDISGVLPSDVPLYEQQFDIRFPVQGIAPPVKPEEPIAEERYTPDLSVFKDGGVVKSENGIEGLLERRQQAVNRMLLKRAGSHFGS